MPLPTPKGREQKKDFVSRCIATVSHDKTFKDQKQVIAVCYSQWEHAKASADVIVGSGDQETLFSAQRFGGKKRSELKDSDFLYPNERSFPIVTPKDVSDAVHSFGRSKGKDFEDFKKRLVHKARSKGAAFVKALPDTIKEQFKIESREQEDVFTAPSWTVGAKGQRFGGKKRSELKDSDFLYPEERSFPIVTPKDVHDAAKSFGRSKGKNYEDFKKRLVRKAKSKGPAFVAELPDTIKEEHNIKASEGDSLVSQYADKAAEMLSETLACASTILACANDESYHAKLTEPWVFTKIAIAKLNSCGVRYHIEFGDIKAADSEENVREEYVEMAKELLTELVANTQASLRYIHDNQKAQEEISKPWVFEKVVVAKSMSCIVKNHLLYGEDPEATEYPAEQDPQNPEQSIADDEFSSNTEKGQTGENTSEIREAGIRNAFDNRWGADTY